MSEHTAFLLKYGTPDHVDSAIKRIANTSECDRTWDQKAALEDLVDTGNKQHINTMLAHHGINNNVRYHIAKYGDDSHRDHLLKSYQHFTVHKAIAQYSNDSHRDKLLDDKNEHVRSLVAEFGNDKHREHLLNRHYPSKVELNTIHHYGHKEHRAKAGELLDQMARDEKRDADRYGR